MSTYKNFTGEDVSEDTGIVTSGIWQDGASNITTFFSSSTQYTNTGDYNIDVYRYDPSANASASDIYSCPVTVFVNVTSVLGVITGTLLPSIVSYLTEASVSTNGIICPPC